MQAEHQGTGTIKLEGPAGHSDGQRISGVLNTEENRRGFTLRAPTPGDGVAIWNLVRNAKPLDENSCYAYLLLCEHFADTCVVAEREGAIIGFISAYLPPKTSDVVFVWQVAVDSSARGMGVARAMLMFLLMRDACKAVHFLETTVSPSNAASRALFQGLAKRLKTQYMERPLFRREQFGEQDHEDEILFRIGPVQSADFSKANSNENETREESHGK